MQMREFMDLVEMSAKNRHRAAAVSLHRLLTQAGAEFNGTTFQKEEADRLGLMSDFKRALDDGLIEKWGTPDWYEPTERGKTAMAQLDKSVTSTPV